MRRIAIGILIVALMAVGAVYVLNTRDEAPPDAGTAFSVAPEQIARGAYLARAGNCEGCHTARGGMPYAGGRGIDTPFGTVYAPNLTAAAKTGLGEWTPADFWRALHNGRSRDGRLLYPAFPYPNYTHVTRADADALFAYLRSLPAVERANRPHALRFPYDHQIALAVWRALYFRPGTFVPEADRSAEWNRGAYLVQGLGHCNACHSSRNFLGATDGTLDLNGGLIPTQNWYAPSLTSTREAGLAQWDPHEIVGLLKAGVAKRGSVSGPMAAVVARSTQFLSDADLHAMAAYLKALPQSPELPVRNAKSLDATQHAQGAELYRQHCAHCHGDDGVGIPGAYPPLAGNRAVTLEPPANVVRMVLGGGFPPGTAGNPRPYGMPPFVTILGDDDIAAVISYVRDAWGNQGSPVSAFTVGRFRGHHRD